MNILIWMLILASIILGALVIISPNKSSQKPNQQKEPDQQKGPTDDSQKVLISTLEEQLFSAKDELEKIKAEYVNIQEEVGVVKKRELDLREELMRQKDWYDKKVEEFEKLKNDYLPLKNKLEKEISEDINLNKEIQEKDGIIESLKKKNQELADQVQDLNARVKKYGPQ